MVVLLDVGNVDETSDSDAVELHETRDMQAVRAINNFIIENYLTSQRSTRMDLCTFAQVLFSGVQLQSTDFKVRDKTLRP